MDREEGGKHDRRRAEHGGPPVPAEEQGHPTKRKPHADAQQRKLEQRRAGEQDARREDIFRGEVFGISLFIEYPRSILESLEVELDNQAKEK